MTTKLFLTGIVQGVGFRPCCKKVADEMQLSGTVRNLGGNAEIVIRSENRVTEEFLRRLVSLLPEEARIDSINEEMVEDYCENGFKIITSGVSNEHLPEIIPDLATCPQCLCEMKDPSNRRYRHPFISCSACGPRYSIIKSLPYDRETTLMDVFPLCEKCAKEYTDPTDRRLHAQTVACKECGPSLFWAPSGGEPLDRAESCLKSGGVVGIKDIGGFHFACLPDSPEAVKRLRLLKRRDQKPFAVMFPSLESIKEYAETSSSEEDLLLSSARPIVLLEKNKDFCKDVCGDSLYIGAMLPCNPVQQMLCDRLGPLVMTSGNLSGEPIITENEIMLELCEKSEFLDGVLYHNRDIITALDDSIFYVLDREAHIMRRGRGIAPASLKADLGSKTIFAAGGDLKSCFGFYKNGRVILSQHFGDLEDDGCEQAFLKAAKHMSGLFDFKPDLSVCDMHPSYFSRSLSDKLYGQKALEVQHHHAHIASVMAEHGLSECLGFALDGTGFGADAKVWGGEVLLCTEGDYERVAHLSSVRLCGGDQVAKNAREALACYLLAAGKDIPESIMNPDEAKTVKAALKLNIGCMEYSGCGRLFDAVAALLEICDYNHYEGQCAMALEKAAALYQKSGGVAHSLKIGYNDGVLDTLSLIGDIYSAKNQGANIGALALGFHYAIAEGIVEVAKDLKIPQIALSGGTFNNRILTSYLKKRLLSEGFEVYLNQNVPTGDGGIALGQLFIAGKEKL